MQMDITRISGRINALLILGIFLTGFCMRNNSDWFQAQSECAARNQTLTTDRTMPGSIYWTARYQRVSRWIKLIGCFNETDVMQHAAVKATTMENSSAGYCQEICMKSNLSIFAMKNSICLCLRKWFTESESNASKCNFTCPNNIDGKFTKECGGETAFNVFKSKKVFSCNKYRTTGDCVAIECIKANPKYYCSKCTELFHGLCQPGDSSSLIKNITYLNWENSTEKCKKYHSGYLLGNLPLSNVSNACNRINKTEGGLAWIGAAKQKYQGIDQGYSIETGEKANFIICEQCQNSKCSFVNCANKIHRVVCSQINFSTVTYPPPSTTTERRRTTGRITAPETTIATTETTTTTTERTQFTQSSTITETDTAGTVDHLENRTSNPSEKKSTGLEVSVIVVPIIFILFGIILGGTGFIFWRRRKAKKEKEPVPENPTIYLNVKQGENEHVYHEENNVSNSSYFILEPKSSYDEYGNDIPQVENPYIEAKEGEYDHLGKNNRRRKVTENEDYDETTKDESLNKKVEEGNYDHLGNTSSRKSVADDTYCHTSSKQLDDSSDYDVANRMEQHDLENTYDHARAGKHLHNDSNYDYSELKR